MNVKKNVLERVKKKTKNDGDVEDKEGTPYEKRAACVDHNTQRESVASIC